ncbi:FAD-dependent oxidoreductase [Phytohabitans kaempferiae]|uniref:FAD-dependent oxidoreductase n=1 Tax=Phytohabitans kaempferiae TaxID=1620943 RepID=A0ABV6MH35_9ACTN
MTDVIVCGGGVAGLAAAVRAATAGADTLVLEKAPRLGGSALLSNGTLWTFADPERAARLMPGADHLLQETVIAEAAATLDWIAGLGVPLGATVDMVHGTGRSVDPAGLVDLLRARLLGLGGRIELRTPLRTLTPDPTAGASPRAGFTVNGEWNAPAVVLATGGFQGNPELLTRYGIAPDHVYLRASPWSTGDGLLAALALGAATTAGLDGFYGHAMLAALAAAAPQDMSASSAAFGPREFREVSQYFGPLSYAVGLDGRRFTDESAGTGEESLNEALARRPGGRGYYLGDARVLATDALPGRLATRTIVERAAAKGAAVTAPTLDSLAAALADHGVPAAALLDTVHAVNRAGATGGWGDLYPPRARHRYGLTEPPFFAVAVKASLTFTTGGVAVDHEQRVLDRAASTSPIGTLVTDPADVDPVPIPGLYAAGCDVGGLSHAGYFGGLLPALVTGRRAGTNAART